jgi:hypothetical protein
MRVIFGILSLLIVVALVGFLSKKQLSSVNEIKVPATEPAGMPTITAKPTGSVQQQSQQIQQQFKAATDAAVQQARPMPDEK